MSYGQQQTIAHTFGNPAGGAVHRDPRCCQLHQVLRRTKVNLTITVYVGYDDGTSCVNLSLHETNLTQQCKDLPTMIG